MSAEAETPLFAVRIEMDQSAQNPGGTGDHPVAEGCDIKEVHLTLREGTDEETVFGWVRVSEAADAETPVRGMVLIYHGFDGHGKSWIAEQRVESAEALAEGPGRLVIGDRDLTFREFVDGIAHGGSMTLVFHRKSSTENPTQPTNENNKP